MHAYVMHFKLNQALLSISLRRPVPHHRTPLRLVNRVEAASKAPRVSIPAFRSQKPDAPVTITEVEQQQTTFSQTKVIEEQVPTSLSSGRNGDLAYDGAVAAGSLGLEAVEGLAVLAAVPAILVAGTECSTVIVFFKILLPP